MAERHTLQHTQPSPGDNRAKLLQSEKLATTRPRPYIPAKITPIVNTSVTAIISKEWKQRILIMALAVSGLGCWFLYDGLVAYPKNNVKAAVYFPLRDQLGKDTPELEAAWAAARKERHWNEKTPKKIYSPDSLRTQIILGILSLLGGGAIVLYYFRSLPLTTRLQNGRIILPDGREIELTQIRAVSKRRWDSKGIADLVYESAPGKTARFLLDDYKFIGAAQILAEVEKNLTPPLTQETPASSSSDETTY